MINIFHGAEHGQLGLCHISPSGATICAWTKTLEKGGSRFSPTHIAMQFKSSQMSGFAAEGPRALKALSFTDFPASPPFWQPLRSPIDKISNSHRGCKFLIRFPKRIEKTSICTT